MKLIDSHPLRPFSELTSHFCRTLKNPVVFEGVGLHSGKKAILRLLPAPAEKGRFFVRTDLPDQPEIPCHPSYVKSTDLATTLSQGEASVSTSEHLLAALYAVGIDSVRMELEGPEVPILDGSALGFYQVLKAEKKKIQAKRRTFLKIKKRFEVTLGQKTVLFQPHLGFSLKASIDWNHPYIRHQEFIYQEQKTPFELIAQARTFGFTKDFEALKQKGLIQGGSLENAIVLSEDAVMNPEGLRSPLEFVHHKILDALGDFALAGVRWLGHIQVERAGHALHVLALQELFRNPHCFELLSDEGTSKGSSKSLPTRFISRLASS